MYPAGSVAIQTFGSDVIKCTYPAGYGGNSNIWQSDWHVHEGDPIELFASSHRLGTNCYTNAILHRRLPSMVAATIDTPAHASLACGLWLVLALFMRLRFQHDSVVAGAVGVGVGVTCSSG